MVTFAGKDGLRKRARDLRNDPLEIEEQPNESKDRKIMRHGAGKRRRDFGDARAEPEGKRIQIGAARGVPRSAGYVVRPHRARDPGILQGNSAEGD